MQAFRGGLCRVERLRADHAGCVQALRADRFAIGIGGLDLQIRQRGGGGVAVGARRSERGVGLRTVKRRQHLAGLHAQAFFGINLFHPACNFGGDCGAAAGRNIPAGIEKRLSMGPTGGPCRGHFDQRLL